MVRTKADGGSSGSRKAVASSAPRKALGGGGPSTSAASPAAAGKYAGGNSYCPRPTPDWQKGIASFMSTGKSNGKENDAPATNEQEAGSSSNDADKPGPSSVDCEDSN